MAILEVGDKFAGCRVEQSKDTENGHVWIFSRGNEAVVMSLRYDDYFIMIAHPQERERILDQMALELHQTLRDREKKISSLDVKG